MLGLSKVFETSCSGLAVYRTNNGWVHHTFLQFKKLVTVSPAAAQLLRCPLYDRIWNALLILVMELRAQFIRSAIIVMDRSVSFSSVWIR